jgi:hypothetical protein
VALDAARLQHEAASLPAEAWVSHPKAVPGNSAVRLITVDGGDNDSLYGTMLPTRFLQQMPYVQQLLASFGVVWSRSRLMRLAPGAEVPEHADINYHWFNRVRLHMPVVTHPSVRFSCGDESVHMAAGEAWVFDNWRLHSVVNPSPHERIHLVADTTGNAAFWRIVLHSTPQTPPRTVEFHPGETITLLTERNPPSQVMSPNEVELLLHDLAAQLVDAAAPLAATEKLATYRELLADFILDWRHCHFRYGEDPDGLSAYVGLREELRARSTSLADGLAVLSNGVAAHDALADRILRQLLRPASEPPARGETPRAAQRVRSAKDRFFSPVFIVGAPRSGSTLLYETLAVNSAFCNLGGEAHWLVESIPALRPGASGVDSNRLTGDNVTDAISEQIAESILRRAMLTSGELVGLRASGLRLLEKTPKNSLRIPLFDRIFPDARFIFLWRDPHENISSIMEAWRTGRWITYREMRGWDGPWSLLLPPRWRELRNKPLEEIAAYQWSCTNQIVLDDLSKLDAARWTVVEYSELIAKPRELAMRLCAFCGVEMDDATRARVSAPLPLSRYTQTPPQPGKWRRNEPAISRVIPSVQTVWDRMVLLRRAALERA